MKKINKIKNKKPIKTIKNYLKKINLKTNKFNTIEMILILIMGLVFGILIGEMLFGSGKTLLSIKNKNTVNITEIENVYNTLKEEYINKISEEDLKEAAIQGMVSTLGDQHSSYYNEKASEEFKEELNGYFYGIGAGISGEKGKLVTVSEIYKNSPAAKAGLKKGDKYLKINGQDVTNLSAEEISNKIKGKKGQTFKLTIKRNNEEKEITITTDKIEIPSINKEIITKQGQKIGYITIKVFASNTDEQFEKALKELDKENINNLIIDLRNNQGGELNTVINIASNFLNKKQPIIQIETKNNKEIKYSTKNPEKTYKITVLINENSASASEVLAAALNEQINATLIGKTSYGKGTVQKTKTLPSGGLIKYTIETWKTSKGKNIDGKGITPTIEITQNENYYKDYNKKYDTQLNKAIETALK